MKTFDIIVLGAGHAGCEAAYAAARLGAHVGLCTLSADTVAHMPCNPAIGGTAKGHLVREIDALGGLMGRAIDATGIQFKLLNRSRGPAVWSPRAQADKKTYRRWVKAALDAEPNIEWLFGKAGRILVEHGRIVGLAFEDGDAYGCRALVVTTGTFLNGLVHVGPEQHQSGRAGEPPSRELAESIKSFAFEWGRLKTGTPPRLDRDSIDFDRHVATGAFTRERGDDPPVPFSFLTSSVDGINRPQIDCYLLHTNDRVRDLVRANIDRSPLFNGQIRGIGPRYCPSLEDKIVRFPDKERHQIFLEPEGIDAREIYVNGFSMSLPREVQAELVHALPGLEHAQARGEAHPGSVSRGADQRNVGIRRGRRAGTRRRCQRGARRDGARRVRAAARRGVHRHPGRRSDHEGLSRAVPDVHVARGASTAAADRQRRSATNAAWARRRARR
jgi:tRNA uridine 5-carboxymethylaminomethyl modification enzyme